MHWKTILFGFLKGIVEVLADEYRLLAKRRAARQTHSKEAPTEPTMAWGSPSPPPPVAVIRIETDEGSRVAAASFVGSEYFGQKKVEKERQAGESRRRRRKVRDEAATTSISTATSSTEETSTNEAPDAASGAVVRPPAPARAARTRRPVLMLSTATLATLARGAA